MTDLNNKSSQDHTVANNTQSERGARKCCCERTEGGRCCGRRRGWGRWLVRIILIVALLFGISAAFKAYRWHSMDEPQRTVFIQERVHHGISDALDLQAPQQKQLDKLLQHVQEQRSALHLPQWRARAQSVIAGTQFDQAAAAQLINDATQTLQREAPSLIHDVAAFYDSLTPTQQAQLRTRLNHSRRD